MIVHVYSVVYKTRLVNGYRQSIYNYSAPNATHIGWEQAYDLNYKLNITELYHFTTFCPKGPSSGIYNDNKISLKVLKAILSDALKDRGVNKYSTVNIPTHPWLESLAVWDQDYPTLFVMKNKMVLETNIYKLWILLHNSSSMILAG